MLLDAIDLVRVTFIGAALTVLTVYLIPALRSRFLDYGPRSNASTVSSAEREKQSEKTGSTTALDSTLDKLAKIKVPHSWFASFYAVSVTLSLFWIIVLPVFRSYLPALSYLIDFKRASTPFARTQLACILMLCQGVRRLAECLLFITASSSSMWIGHWLVGLLFYVGMSVAVWIEGVPALLVHEFSIRDVEITTPSLRTAFSLLLFAFASGIQHDCHAYLTSLKRESSTLKSKDTAYRLPTHPAFNISLTPHYFMECLLYLSLSILAAPDGHWFNGSIVCALVFVVTNLGVTALGTRKWYAQRFGSASIKGRWAMIPSVL